MINQLAKGRFGLFAMSYVALAKVATYPLRLQSFIYVQAERDAIRNVHPVRE
jgi:hypothetical protein